MSFKLIVFCIITGVLIGLLPLLFDIPDRKVIRPVAGDRLLIEKRQTTTEVVYELVQ